MRTDETRVTAAESTLRVFQTTSTRGHTLFGHANLMHVMRPRRNHCSERTANNARRNARCEWTNYMILNGNQLFQHTFSLIYKRIITFKRINDYTLIFYRFRSPVYFFLKLILKLMVRRRNWKCMYDIDVLNALFSHLYILPIFSHYFYFFFFEEFQKKLNHCGLN